MGLRTAHRQNQYSELQEPIWSRIRLLSIKLRAIAYLVGNQSTEDPPLDLEQIYMGIGLLLEEVSEAMRGASTEMEVKDIRSRKKI